MPPGAYTSTSTSTLRAVADVMRVARLTVLPRAMVLGEALAVAVTPPGDGVAVAAATIETAAAPSFQWYSAAQPVLKMPTFTEYAPVGADAGAFHVTVNDRCCPAVNAWPSKNCWCTRPLGP
ncbi:MAG: hypothetical protein EXR63_02735 [Dehalococcoidia bacterium]|nr:hypothetical protein [Dehalococcoidia bacterium]